MALSAWAALVGTASAGGAPAMVNWPAFGQNLMNWRLSDASQITVQNAASVGPLFSYAFPKNGGGAEDDPVESQGTLYGTSSGGFVYAFDAATGALRWTYTPSPVVSGTPNRGVAVDARRVYVLTPDDRLIALNRQSGRLVYDVQVADPSTGAFETTAPVVADGKVLVGVAGGDQGVRGFVAAYAAATGKRLWQTYMVPPAGKGWMAGPGVHGGGAVWMPPAVNLATKTVFVATGNPAPDFFGPVRPGADPHTDSIVALSLATGAMRWAYAETRHDQWDYDAASPPVLFNLRRHGRTIPAVAEAGKDGEFYVLAQATGKPLTAPVAFVHVHHPAPTATGTLVYPGSSGGDNYGPVAYDPGLGLAFVGAVDGGSIVYAANKDAQGSHSVAASGPWSGSVSAIDVSRGKVAWTVKTATPVTGGVSVTADGIVWFGSEGGHLYAVDARTGKVLLRLDAGASIGAAPAVYQLAGREYVAVAVGGSGSMETEPFSRPGPALRVFGLPAAGG